MRFKFIINEGGPAGGPGGGCPGGGPGGPGPGPGPGGMSTPDIGIGGGCKHDDHGYFGPGCFHIPFPILGGVGYYKRRKKKKGKKSKGYAYDNVKVIKTYDDLVSEDEEQYELVMNIPSEKLVDIIDMSRNENDRFNIEQFTKFLDDNKQLMSDKYEIVGIFGIHSHQCFAMAVLYYDWLGLNDCYINELMTLKHGFGKILLNEIIAHTENTWLMSDIDSGEELCDKFYRRNQHLTEITIGKNNVYFDKSKPNTYKLHLFYADNCEQPDAIKEEIIKAYTTKDKSKHISNQKHRSWIVKEELMHGNV